MPEIAPDSKAPESANAVLASNGGLILWKDERKLDGAYGNHTLATRPPPLLHRRHSHDPDRAGSDAVKKTQSATDGHG